MPSPAQYAALGSALDSKRELWDSLWQELADLCHPRRATIQRKEAAGSSPDQSRLESLYDGTAMRAADVLARGCSARITPMGSQWMILRPPDDLSANAAALDWYARCTEILMRAFYASNFYQRAHEHYKDRGVFGTACTQVIAGANGRGLHFRARPVGTFAIDHDDREDVNLLSSTFKWSPRKVVSAFGRNDGFPEDLRKMEADPQTADLDSIEIRHLILPRQDRDPRKLDTRNKPYASIYLWTAKSIVLEETGFDEFPEACSRWELWGDSPYGWSPAYHALPEARQANFLEEMLDTLAETAAFPRVLYAGNLKGEIDFSAMGLTCWDPMGLGTAAAPQEWLTGGRYDIGKDRLQDKRRAIDEAFFVPLFNAVSQLDRDATATEIRAIVSESRELFHPIFAGLTREFLGKVIRRSFALLLRQGAMPAPPAAVFKDNQDGLGAFIDAPQVEFTSSMALALEQSQLANLQDIMTVLGPLAQADPASLDFLNLDTIGPALFRARGLPAGFVRSPDDIAALREARAQAQQAQQAEQMSAAVRNLGGPAGLQQLQTLAAPAA